MFLGEVALGKEYGITMDDSSLRQAPAGYDCVVARGRTEPGYFSSVLYVNCISFCASTTLVALLTDPKLDTTVTLDTKTVKVPQGKPLTRSEFTSSHFSQSEYLIYKESQVKLRYLFKFKFGGYH